MIGTKYVYYSVLYIISMLCISWITSDKLFLLLYAGDGLLNNCTLRLLVYNV